MAVTLGSVKKVIAGNSIRITGTITGPASYTTGGETLTATQIGQLTGGQSSTSLSSIVTFDPSQTDAANFRSPVLDITNKKVLYAAGATQVTSTTDLSALTIGFEALVKVVNG